MRGDRFYLWANRNAGKIIGVCLAALALYIVVAFIAFGLSHFK